MNARSALAGVAALTVVVSCAACGGSTVAGGSSASSSASMSQPDAPTPSANRAAAATCNPADPRQNPDLIIWQRWPDLPDDSIRVGSLKPDCSRTLDSWTDDEPTGPGHCSKIAWGYDNPNYPYGERPAPPLKHVIDTVGDCS